MPFVRSCDENNGRVVFKYDPETFGYVSYIIVLILVIYMIINSFFDLELAAIEMVVNKQL